MQSGATRSKRTLKRLGPRVSSDRCRARCCHELRQEVIHDGAAAANGLPTCATPLRQPPEAEAATAEQTSQLWAALVKQHQQSAHGPGARGCTRNARSRRTFAACDQKKARRARVRVSVRAVLGLYVCNRVASEAASTRLVANCSPRSPHHRFPSGRPSAKPQQEHQKLATAARASVSGARRSGASVRSAQRRCKPLGWGGRAVDRRSDRVRESNGRPSAFPLT